MIPKTLTHNTWLFLLFAIYVAVIFGFGGIYYVLYLSDRQNFSFAADIQGAQSKLVSMELEQELAPLYLLERNYVQLIDSSRKAVVLFALSPQGAVAALQSGFRVKITPLASAPAGTITVIVIEAFSGSGERLRKSSLEWWEPFGPTTFPNMHPKTQDDFRAICENELLEIQSQIHIREQKRATFNSGSPDLWSYVDFLYFSTITQTTVGYGDILPNRSVVRVCVMIQILLGYLLLAILLNIAFGK